MKSIFEEMGGTYRQEGDYLIPNLTLPDEPEYQIGKYGRMRRNYLKEHRPVLYANLLTSGTLHRHQMCIRDRPYMDADMRELAKRTLSKVDALTEAEFAELPIYAADEV